MQIGYNIHYNNVGLLPSKQIIQEIRPTFHIFFFSHTLTFQKHLFRQQTKIKLPTTKVEQIAKLTEQWGLPIGLDIK